MSALLSFILEFLGKGGGEAYGIPWELGCGVSGITQATDCLLMALTDMVDLRVCTKTGTSM